MSAIGDHKDLDVFKETASRPKRFTIVTIYLVKSFFDLHAPALELDVHHRQAVDQDRDIITVSSPAVLHAVLIEHLQAVVVDIGFIQQIDVFHAPIIAAKQLDMIFLDDCRLFLNAIIGICQLGSKKALPLIIAELEAVQSF